MAGSRKQVISLSLPKFNVLHRGTRLGWWRAKHQAGTAPAEHPAWRDFPHKGYLDPGLFRLVDHAEKLDPGHHFHSVEPLMVGIGRDTSYHFGTLGYPLRFNLYLFQARIGKGSLLDSGLKLRTDKPEAICLLDQLVRYASSEQFAPRGTLDADVLGKKAKLLGKFISELNGWVRTVKATERTQWKSLFHSGWMASVRQTDGHSELIWEPAAAAPAADGFVHFRWIANLGWQSQPAGAHFTLYLSDRKLLNFDITLKSTVWKSAGGNAQLRYTVKSLDRNEDSSGVMELVLPASMLPPDGTPARFRVTGSAGNSRRYFGLYEFP